MNTLKEILFPPNQDEGAKKLTILAIIILILGLIGIVDRIINGHIHADYGSYIPWGLWIAGYNYLIGLSAGAFFVSALVYVFNVKVLEKIAKLALLTALATLIAALLTVWFDLGHMSRAWRLALRTNFGSIMGWMSWLYSAYAVLLTIELWIAIKPDLSKYANENSLRGKLCNLINFGKKELTEEDKKNYRKTLKILSSIGIPLVIAFDGSVGAIFGVVGARPYWHSGLTPIIFIFGALLSGVSLLAFILWFWRPKLSQQEFEAIMNYLGNLILGLLLFDVILEWAKFSISLWHAVPEHAEGFKMILFGHFWWVFWIVHLGLGVVIPLYFLLKGRIPKNVAIAGGLIAITFLSVRLNIVIPGLHVAELEGLKHSFTGPGLVFKYIPTIWEWLVFFFTISVGSWIFLLGKSLLPILDIEQPNKDE
jgi:molybdopterin-containing oxidoreductase family membrane subunit